MSERLTLAQAQDIAGAISARQAKFDGEQLLVSVITVVLNYGDRFTPVRCVRGEWSGIKDDLPRTETVPVCPNGHVLLEANRGRKALGLVDDEALIPEPPTARDADAIARAEQHIRSLEAQAQQIVLRTTPTAPNDPLERLLELVTQTIDTDDLTIGYGGNDPTIPTWYAYAYFRAPMNAPPEDGAWEIEAQGQTLRAVLCDVIAHPRFRAMMDELRPCKKHWHHHVTDVHPLLPDVLYWQPGCHFCQEATLCTDCECIVDGWKTKLEDRDLKCLLPVVRQRYVEERDERESYVDSCGESLFVATTCQSQLAVGGPMEINNPWKVECLAGHVLFLPDDEGNDHDIPFEFEEFVRAYKYIAEMLSPSTYLIAATMDQTVHDD